MRERRADRDRGVHPGDDVRDRHAGALRAAPGRAIGLAGDAHHAAHALDHEVVPRTLAVGAGMAKTGERAVDEPRVELAQRRIAETVAVEVAVLEILDQHVALARKLARDLLAFGRSEVERDGFLAAVGRGEISGVAG